MPNRIASNIIVNGTSIDTCRKVIVNGAEAQKVIVNGVTVYELSCPPTTPIHYDTVQGPACEQYTHNFNESVGIPTPQYDLYRDNVLYVSNILPGHLTSCDRNTAPTFYVKAHNIAGSIDSNTDTANCVSCLQGFVQLHHDGRLYGDTHLVTSGCGSGTHTFTVPPGVTTITLKMVGGGGSGSIAGYIGDPTGGGYAGHYYETSISVSEGNTFCMLCGDGGGAISTNGCEDGFNGSAGSTSTFGSYSVGGGAGGDLDGYENPSNGFHGDGEAKDGVLGTVYNGLADMDTGCHPASGGEASMFGNGGNAESINMNIPSGAAEPGIDGGGGGAMGLWCGGDAGWNDGVSGAGGGGVIRIEYN